MILVTQDTREIAELDRRIVEAKDAVNEANQTLRSAADGNQIYRLAASWYRVSTSKALAIVRVSRWTAMVAGVSYVHDDLGVQADQLLPERS